MTAPDNHATVTFTIGEPDENEPSIEMDLTIALGENSATKHEVLRGEKALLVAAVLASLTGVGSAEVAMIEVGADDEPEDDDGRPLIRLPGVLKA